MRTIANAISKALQSGTTDAQYLAFERVTKADLGKIDSSPTSLGRHTRMSFYADIDLLIIKLMPSVVHKAAYRLLSRKFENKIQALGVPEYELLPLGSGRFEGRNSSKEADEAYKPLPTRGLIDD